MAAYQSDHIQFLRGLQSPTDAQRLLLLLHDRGEQRTPEDTQRLADLWESEWATSRATEMAASARRRSNAIVDGVKSAERKARDHALYQSAGLLIVAGLVDSQTGRPTRDASALLGALLHVAAADEASWAQWQKTGSAALNGNKGGVRG
jgi:hypothetical protein